MCALNSMGDGVVEVLFGGKSHDSEAPSIFRHVSGLQSECSSQIMRCDVKTNSQKEKKRVRVLLHVTDNEAGCYDLPSWYPRLSFPCRFEI